MSNTIMSENDSLTNNITEMFEMGVWGYPPGAKEKATISDLSQVISCNLKVKDMVGVGTPNCVGCADCDVEKPSFYPFSQPDISLTTACTVPILAPK